MVKYLYFFDNIILGHRWKWLQNSSLEC